jgi:protein TonB
MEEMLQKGGVLMRPLLLCSILSLAIAIAVRGAPADPLPEANHGGYRSSAEDLKADERRTKEPPADEPGDVPFVMTGAVDPVEREVVSEKVSSAELPPEPGVDPAPDSAAPPVRMVRDVEDTSRPELISIESLEPLSDGSRPVPPGIPNRAGAGSGSNSLAALSLPAPKKTWGALVAGLKGESPARIAGLSRPRYPRYSRLYREEGTTELLVEILADGNLGAIEVFRSSGYQRLDQAAVSAIREAEAIVPARKDGRNVTSKTRIDFKFDLEDWDE